MSFPLLLALQAGVAACWYLIGRNDGRARGRADAFAEVQRWHLEDDEALKRAAYREPRARSYRA